MVQKRLKKLKNVWIKNEKKEIIINNKKNEINFD